jgi:hypothetical protein
VKYTANQQTLMLSDMIVWRLGTVLCNWEGGSMRVGCEVYRDVRVVSGVDRGESNVCAIMRGMAVFVCEMSRK